MLIEVQQVLAQLSQLQSEQAVLASRVAALESAGTGTDDGSGMGAPWFKPGIIGAGGGDEGDLTGNSGGSVTIQGSLAFDTAPDSNVVVATKDGGAGDFDGKIEIGVYYV